MPLAWILGVAMAGVATITPADDLVGSLNALTPGDELVLGEGTYELTQRAAVTLLGTEQAPIVIRAADGVTAHVHRPNAAQNLIDFEDAQWVVLRDLVFSGGSAGLRFQAAQHLTIEGCEIRETDDVALRFNEAGADYVDIHIVGNQVHHTDHTGEGMYLGCPGGRCVFRESIIERNWVHHTNGPDITQGDGIEIKKGSWGNVVRDNVIHDTNYPCIISYDTGGNPPNIIERNVMWRCGNHGIQSAADSVIRNNIVLSAAAAGIALQPHDGGAPSNQIVVHNTVLNVVTEALAVRDPTGSVVVANNALYAPGGTALRLVNPQDGSVEVTGNVTEGSVSPGVVAVEGSRDTDLVSPHSGGAPPMDVFPAVGSTLLSAASAGHLATDDFNGTARTRSDAGAYEHDPAGNPGWTIEAGFKTGIGTTATGDTGSVDGTDPPIDPGTDAVEDGLVDEPLDGGCACSGGGGAPFGVLLPLALVGWLRRRGARCACPAA